MDIVVKGRNVEVPTHYREHVGDKLTRLERYDRKSMRADVELFHERNPRQAKNCQRVEITLKCRGPAVRAEASAADFYSALDAATNKLETRLSRMHDRRKVHHGRHTPRSVAEATAAMADRPVAMAGAESGPAGESNTRTALLEESREGVSERTERDVEVPDPRWRGGENEPGRIVREKEHTAAPMTVDQALYEMELVGHDFYLFSDADSGKPSVVYRRKGFDYGVIRLAA
ncbi:SSU ribosomal protein S30P /sigma 54 modulation protein [Halopolyspora algeriensis]|uniref:Ribosome hibernation promoting factor n=1 Tax=Halopolyspora algeriensis TaxID=1500506 RepID=A0A368VJQ4_9ACTN|nr:ribosome-associated translation inhibitor RaiA [Halopolyspora algeriensis]RCW39221.1 SSU ribosomal protein S30P /sigma 54 modulation protein [Halopolyspora algeriensis]TQM47413.1 SSU ribosomal protein S30P /sigma 54 modulation protein [Halopolyspora algeriensis]